MIQGEKPTVSRAYKPDSIQCSSMERDQPLAMVCLAYQRRWGELKDAGIMRIEHFALNVADPIGMARWYVEHLGMRIALGSNKPPYGHFLADGGEDVMIEIYHNPADAIPDYAAQPPARMHLAFVSADPAGDRDRLLAAGAGYVEEVHLPNGGHIVTLRDPWGLAFQLVKRGTPMLP